MTNIAVFASGNGSNFQAVAEFLKDTEHRVVCLVCDNPEGYVLERAKTYSIPSHIFDYSKQSKPETETEILSVLRSYEVEFIVLAGFMRILSDTVLNAFQNRIINIHPSLLPKYPGVDAIGKSYHAGDTRLGITIHWVDKGVDTGPIILQKSFERTGKESLEEVEEQIHTLEHAYYPIVIKNILDGIERRKT